MRLTATSMNDYFDVIKKNHAHMLEMNQLTHLAILGCEHKKAIIDRYVSCIQSYREDISLYLNEVVQAASMMDGLERGLWSTLVGASISALFFMHQRPHVSMDVFGAKTAMDGGFAGLIGVGAGMVVDEWLNARERRPVAEEREACMSEFRKAGFNDEKYQSLATELVKLFHFRECLLLGLCDAHQVNFRHAFQTRYYARDFSAEDFNLSVEAYFLQQLNTLFHEAFTDLYHIHEAQIEEEQKESSIVHTLKTHFQRTDTKGRFTQQMQMAFMRECIRFLEQEMAAPSDLKTYLYWIDVLAGLLAAILVLSLCLLCGASLGGLGMVCILLSVFVVVTLGVNFLISTQEAWMYQRDADNRLALERCIQSIRLEQGRLTQLMRSVIMTNAHELQELHRTDRSYTSWLHPNKKQVALGSVASWLREYARRFQESMSIEVDLQQSIRSLILKADQQTLEISNALKNLMCSEHKKSSESLWLAWLNSTREALCDPKQRHFVVHFNSIPKIKEQVLDIVARLPAGDLMPALVSWYTDMLERGGLGGCWQDLMCVRELAPVAMDDSKPVYDHLLQVAFLINLKLNQALQSNWILKGDAMYRMILGLPPDRSAPMFSVANISMYLDASFAFLCTLDDPHDIIGWKDHFFHSHAFIVYHLLLVKQLATMVRLDSGSLEPLIKDDLLQFARERLNIDPEVAFDEVINQGLLMLPHTSGGVIKDPLGNEHSNQMLESLADAIRLDRAYVTRPWTPQQLIVHELHQFIQQDQTMLVFGEHAVDEFIPECSPAFYTKISRSIVNTRGFIDHLKATTWLNINGSLRSYIQVTVNDLCRIAHQIDVLLSKLPDDFRVPLTTTKNELMQFKEDLSNAYQVNEISEPAVVSIEPAAVPARETVSLDFFSRTGQTISSSFRSMSMHR